MLCNEPTKRSLPGCEHEAELRCSDDPSSHSCTAICGGIMSCCGRTCGSKCSECRALTVESDETLSSESDEILDSNRPVVRRIHKQHLCSKPLFCQHPCNGICSTDHNCSSRCRMPCRQKCIHGSCKSPCSQPCSPCKEECMWQCTHFACLVPCGSVSSYL